MSIATVGEYVETEEIRARIATLGVDYGQGFAIGRPAPLDALLTELPLLVSATAVNRSPEHSRGARVDDTGILNVEFVH
jgi:predicted signal transduction protein with EAL and GGDEF domain